MRQSTSTSTDQSRYHYIQNRKQMHRIKSIRTSVEIFKLYTYCECVMELNQLASPFLFSDRKFPMIVGTSCSLGHTVDGKNRMPSISSPKYAGFVGSFSHMRLHDSKTRPAAEKQRGNNQLVQTIETACSPTYRTLL